ncbi:hypothetical protein [Mesorhizobium sp. ANAO-SY3R2]|uniref:hypothetical protein n=1 Tax=Mesorhizobium sp. ANAO-SY3R2 TaxID=3166644 RepID=UPI003671BE7F
MTNKRPVPPDDQDDDGPTAYETGARAPVARTWPDPIDAFSQDAAGNKKPADKYGNTGPVGEDEEKVRHSEGQNPPGTISEEPSEPGDSAEPGYLLKRHPDARPTRRK